MPTWLKGFLAGITAVVTNFHPVVWGLFILIGLDILSGLVKAFVLRTVSSDSSLRGMAKKSLMLILVGVAGVIQKFLVTGTLPVDLVVGTAGFFCVTEGISILENAAACGVNIPTVLKNYLKQEQK